MEKKLGICMAFLLGACTTDPVPDEDFEGPTLNFPLLGNVPDRPALPPPEAFKRQQNRLKTDHDKAIEKKDAILKSKK